MSQKINAAIDVANLIIDLMKYLDKEVGIYELMNYCYLAQGECLARTGQPLFKEDIIAWENGPVIVEVYEHFKDKLLDDSEVMQHDT